MPIFGDRNTGDYITRDEASRVVGQVNDLATRVSALETLADQLKRSNPAGFRPTDSAVREENRAATTRDPITGGTVRAQGSPVATASTTGVDYGAIAFGLSEIKRKVASLVRDTHLPEADLRREFAGTVQYFADVFAKADTGFDADAFKRQAGV